jgi:hypothetical protein
VRNETVDQVGRDLALVMVLKNKCPIWAAGGEIRCELILNLSESFFHLRGFRELPGKDPVFPQRLAQNTGRAFDRPVSRRREGAFPSSLHTPHR